MSWKELVLGGLVCGALLAGCGDKSAEKIKGLEKRVEEQSKKIYSELDAQKYLFEPAITLESAKQALSECKEIPEDRQRRYSDAYLQAFGKSANGLYTAAINAEDTKQITEWKAKLETFLNEEGQYIKDLQLSKAVKDELTKKVEGTGKKYLDEISQAEQKLKERECALGDLLAKQTLQDLQQAYTSFAEKYKPLKQKEQSALGEHYARLVGKAIDSLYASALATRNPAKYTEECTKLEKLLEGANKFAQEAGLTSQELSEDKVKKLKEHRQGLEEIEKELDAKLSLASTLCFKTYEYEEALRIYEEAKALSLQLDGYKADEIAEGMKKVEEYMKVFRGLIEKLKK